MLKLPKKGFTLVELLIAVAILATLSAFGLATYQGVQSKAQDTRIKADIDAIAKAYESTYDIKTGRYGEISGSNFSGGSVPMQLNGSPYPVTLTPNRGYFEISATLNSGQTYARAATQGSLPTVSPTPTSTNTPTPTKSPLDPIYLASRWALDESFWNGTPEEVRDSSGSLHGTAVNGATTLSGVFQAIPNRYVNFPNTSSLPLNASPRSVCAWAKSSTVSAGFAWIFTYGRAGRNESYMLGRNGARLVAAPYMDDIYDSTATALSFWDTTNWHHVCYVYEGAGSSATLYGDGALKATVTGRTYNTLNDFVYIGKATNGSEYWSGYIDDVRVYRSVLRAADVQSLYDSTKNVSRP